MTARTLRLSKSALLAARFAAPKSGDRNNLKCVRIAENGDVLATSGQVLVHVPHQLGDALPGEAFSIPTAAALKAAKAMPRGGIADVTVAESAVQVDTGRTIICAPTHEPHAAYPDFSHVMPDPKRDAFVVNFNARLLGEALLALAEMIEADADNARSAGMPPVVALNFASGVHGSRSACMITAQTDARTITALVMPTMGPQVQS